MSGLPCLVRALILLATLSTATVARTEVHHVRPGDSVSRVLAQAAPADTVVIHAGEYRERLTIEKPVVLLGEGRPHIRGGYRGHVLLVRAPGVVVDGLWVSESGTRLTDDQACIRVEADSVTLRNNLVTEPLHGIYVKGGSFVVIHDNVIRGRTDLIPADRGNGIHLWNSRHNQIFRNEITEVRDGIYFSFADSTQVEQNYIHHVRYGLHYMYSNDNTFTDNLFERNVAGAALMYSTRILLQRNVFAFCRGFRAYGILHKNVDQTLARHNLIIDNSRGVFVDNSNRNRFENNDIVENDLAFQILGSNDDNVITGNNVINNLSNLLVDNRNTQIIWASESGGNYWSDYKGYDLDGDGFGDVPHKLQDTFQIIETDLPEVRFFRFSPAAAILEMAERAMPILALGTEKDPRPFMRPIANRQVPWNRIPQSRTRPDRVLALTFLAGGLLPLGFLLHLSRRRRK